MLAHVVAYLIGTLIGEMALFGLWAMKQSPQSSGPIDYWRAKKGAAILSACVALAACVLWAEGSLSKLLTEKTDLQFTLGLSVAVGAGLSFFAHSVVKLIAKKTGVESPEQP